MLFLKQVAATQFSALVAVTLLKGITFADTILPGFGTKVVFIGLGLCIWMYLDKSYQQEKILYSLLQLEENLNSPVNEKVLMKVESLETWLREPWCRRLFGKYPLD